MKKLLLLCLGLLASLFFSLPCFAIGENNPTGVTGDWNGSVTTAGSYDPFTGNAKRVVDDLVVTGSIGAYPLKWSRVWNSRGGGGSFGNSNWWHSYVWGMWTKVAQYNYIDNEYEGPAGEVTYPDGRRVTLEDTYEGWVLSGGSEPMDRLVHMGNYDYDLVMRDGGRVKFIASGAPDSNGVTHFTATAIIDPYGRVTTIDYDSLGRFSRITEPGGRYLQINYDRFYPPTNAGSYVDVLSSVQAFASPGNLIETVTYHYTQEVSDAGFFYATFYYLTSVDYDDGSHAYYTYNPAGRSQPGNGWSVVSGSMKSCDDVRYAGPMKRIRYEYMAVSQEHPEIAWGQIKAEKNWDGQTVSEMEYPVIPSNGWDPGWRTEHRGDGATRGFQYLGSELSSYTDFLNHTSSIAYGSAPAPNQSVNYNQTFTDARGNATNSEKDQEAGQVVRRTNPDGTSQTFAYQYVDGAPYYLQIHGDELGRNTYYTRDNTTHVVTKIWYGFNPNDLTAFPTEEFTYNNFGQVLTHKLTSGGTESFEYDNNPGGPATRGLKTKHIDAAGNATLYFYYTSGFNADRLQRVQDPLGNSTFYEYNLRGQVTKVTHQDGSYTQNGYNADGTLAWASDELGHTTRYVYDEDKRVLSVTNPLNQTTSYNYAQDWVNSLIHTTTNPKGTWSPMGKATHYAYDANWRRTIVRQAPATADDAWTFYGYDEVGNLVNTTDPRGNVTTFGYDKRNRQTSITNALRQTTTISFDAVSNKVTESRPDGAFRTWEYEQVNPMNRLVRTVDWRGSPSEPQVATTYERNVTSTTETVTDAKGAVYTFGFDVQHRKTSEAYPPDANSPGRSENFWYDAVGNLILYKNPIDQYKYFSYDSRYRERDTWWNWGGPSVHKDFDTASRLTNVTTNGSETTVSFGYDDANRKIWEDQTLAGYPTHRVSTNPDADGNRTGLWVSNVNGETAYNRVEYTQRNQLARIIGSNGSLMFEFTYDASGNLTQRKSGWWSGNLTNYSYDELNRVTQSEQATNNSIFARSHYEYDTAGREAGTWRDEDNGLGPNKGEKFWYTGTNQLMVVEYNADQVWTGSPANWNRWVGYSYSPDMLNRTSVNDNGNILSFSVSPLNQYTVANNQATGYDSNLNLRSYNGATFNYDAQSRLASATNGSSSILFTYDGLGRCVRRTINGVTTLFTYHEWNPLVEWDGAGNFQAVNIYGDRADEVLLRATASGALYVYKQDQHGNVVALLDGAGNIVERYTYDAFGAPTVVSWNPSTNSRDSSHPNSSAYGNRFMFQGREYLSEFQIYDFRHRMYHPDLGRFLQTDPTGFDAGDMNLFRYCGDDPVDHSDPQGLDFRATGYEFVHDFDDHWGQEKAYGMGLP